MVQMNLVLCIFLFILSSPFCQAQTATDIITKSIESTGGYSGWAALEGYKINAKFDQGGVEFPLEIVHLKDGRKYTKLDFQGTEIMQGVFDGSNLWSTDFQTQKPKKSDRETTSNVGLDSNDFPDALYNYAKKGYTAVYHGKVQFEGREVHKISLKKEPMHINGSSVEDMVYYYIDVRTNLPAAKEFEIKHGPIRGSTMIIRLDNYQQVQGLKFPFTMSQGVKDAPAQPITIESVELDPMIDSRVFNFPN